jgi:hypothetical protein
VFLRLSVRLWSLSFGINYQRPMPLPQAHGALQGSLTSAVCSAQSHDLAGSYQDGPTVRWTLLPQTHFSAIENRHLHVSCGSGASVRSSSKLSELPASPPR